jgi:hypothetical protein
MADQWYYTRQGQRFGPHSIDQMRQMALAGQLLQTDLVWTDGMTEWTAAGRVPQLFAAAPAAGPAVGAPATGGGAPGPGPGDGGLFAALDLNFTRFVTPVIVRWLWIIFLILAPLGYLVMVVTALLGGGPMAGVMTIVVGAVLLILYTLLARMWLEMIAIFFRIAEYLREMSQKK